MTMLGPEDARRAREEDALNVAWGDALRVVLLATGDRKVEDATRAGLLAAGARVSAVLRADDRTSFLERAALVRAAAPDLVVAVAGERRDAPAVGELCEALRLACGQRSPLPRVLLWGDARVTVLVQAILEGWAIEVLPDPRTAGGMAAIVSRAREFRQGTARTLVLRDVALETLARSLARVAAAPALVVDVIGDATSLVRAEPAGAVIAVHLPGPGVGRGADHVVARAGLDRVRRWMPWAIDAPGLLERVFNRARWPDALATDRLSLVLEIALAHEALAQAIGSAGAAGIDRARLMDVPLIAITGRAAELPRRAQTLLVALDSLRPDALCSVLRDRADALVTLGALASRDGGAAIAERISGEIEARHEPLALVAPVDGPRATVRVSASAAQQEHRIARGELRTVPLSGAVEIAASGAPIRGRGVAAGLGLVLDARRPLELPARDAERLPLVASWYEALGALAAEGAR